MSWRASASRANQRIPVHPWISKIGNPLIDAKVLGACLAAHRVNLGFERDLLTFIKRTQARAFDSADVNKNVAFAIVWLDESKTFG